MIDTIPQQVIAFAAFSGDPGAAVLGPTAVGFASLTEGFTPGGQWFLRMSELAGALDASTCTITARVICTDKIINAWGREIVIALDAIDPFRLELVAQGWGQAFQNPIAPQGFAFGMGSGAVIQVTVRRNGPTS